MSSDSVPLPRTDQKPLVRRRSAGTLPGLTPKSRIRRACDRCRELRARCSGGTRCDKCTRDSARCVYSDNKREARQKNYSQAIRQNLVLREQNEALLQALKEIAGAASFEKLKYPTVIQLIEKVEAVSRRESSTEDVAGEPSAERQDDAESLASFEGGESVAPSDIGSPRRQRELPHITSLNHGAGLAGYVGKLSEASWMQRAREYLLGHAPLLEPDVNANRFDYHVLQAMDLTYFMDDEDLLSVDEENMNAYFIPPFNTSLILSEAFFHSMQSAFRFVNREGFLNELVDETNRSPEWPNRRFLALANMMWAVGAKFLEVTGLDRYNLSDGHRVYYARARALGLDHRIHLDHPNIQLVQGTGLLAFYLMINGSIQRAWCVAGQALRYATALGLHLRVATEAISEPEQRKRACLFYSLYRLEVLLSEISGRPKCVSPAIVSVPVGPVSAEGSSVSAHEIPHHNSRELWGTFLQDSRFIASSFSGGNLPWEQLGGVGDTVSDVPFSAAIELTKIADLVEAKLYLAASNTTWLEVQMTVRMLEGLLQAWQNDLPADMRIESIGQVDHDPRSYLELEMYRHSVDMILYRPFLCEIQIEAQSELSLEFNRRCGRACVQAAMNLIELLPDNPVAAHIQQVLPWWALLHYICQAATVLLLELCLSAQHMQDQSQTVIEVIVKAMHHIWCLSKTSKSAYRAWVILRSLVARAMQRYKSHALRDMPVDAQKPANWDERDEIVLEATLESLR